MSAVTYFVALPFARDEQGEICAGKPRECSSSFSAVQTARRMARDFEGSVAFSRSGDPATGEFADAIILQSFGETLEIIFDSARLHNLLGHHAGGIIARELFDSGDILALPSASIRSVQQGLMAWPCISRSAGAAPPRR